MDKWGNWIGIAAMLFVWAGPAAALTDAEKCEAAKLKVAGKYNFCRLKAEAKAVKSGDPADYSKCDSTFGLKWGTAETIGAGMCPSTGDQAAIQAFITLHTDDLAVALNGGPLVDCPGDLAICNGDLSTCSADLTTATADLAACNGDLSTCNANLTACLTTLGGGRIQTGQTICYDGAGAVIACAGTGQDGEVQRGLTPSFTDNGDGTISDNRTGLMWEKLGDDGSIHDQDDTYVWANAFGKIATLNAMPFAGYNDWRLPNVNELQSLANYGVANPAVHAPFNTGCVASCTAASCSCTQAAFPYWCSTTYVDDPSYALSVSFFDGIVNSYLKSFWNFHVRAVRGGP